MASLSLSLPTKPSTVSNRLHSKTPKAPITQSLPSSSQSQFYGLKFFTAVSFNTPSATFRKFSIFAKACAFRDSYEKFKKAGAEVLGISGDSTESHKTFAKKYRLPYTLLSDEGNKVRKEWGVPSDLFGTLPGRETYVLDKNGVVQLVYNNQFQPEKHIDETLKLLQSLK
uniref:Peroxiredoxin Q, chloroplastic n=1 Tax=Kalanchoe fedtschenkoi TaxID=63787 RepID=A0A7N0VC99_KALFE